MENVLAKKLMNWCCKKEADDEIYCTVVEYGLELMIETIWKAAALLCMGAVTGKLKEVLMTIAVFSGLRFWIGGRHRKTSVGCFGCMVFVCMITVAGASGSWIFPQWTEKLILLLCNLIVMIYAPYPSEANPITDKKVIRTKRAGGMITAFMISVIILLVKNQGERWILLLAMLLETISILPNKILRKEKVR